MRSLTFVATLLVGAAAQATEPDCAAPATQLDLNLCASRTLAGLDAELDAAYARASARLGDDDSARKLLVDAQDAWRAYRDADCAFVTQSTEGGSIQPMVAANCRADRTRARLAVVRSWLACPEGDLACPLPPKAP
ncbi:MAG: lysozyme inhibitor LprI family protein [Geminicoccaceae bacterium]